MDLAFDYNEYKFSSIRECDISKLYEWMKKNNNEDKVSLFDEQILYRRFLECYITEDEFFVKVLKDDKLEAVIKGSIDINDNSELFLWLFVIEKGYRDKGEGRTIIESFINYLCAEYSINSVKVGICGGNEGALNFWKSLGFEGYRITKNFFEISEYKFENLVIMNKKINMY